MLIEHIILGGHNVVVNLGDKGNQEVEQNDQVENLVDEPYNPNDRNNKLLLSLITFGFVYLIFNPFCLVVRRWNITNRVAVGHEHICEEVTYHRILIISFFDMHFECLEAHWEEYDPKRKEDHEGHNLNTGLANHLDKES